MGSTTSLGSGDASDEYKALNEKIDHQTELIKELMSIVSGMERMTYKSSDQENQVAASAITVSDGVDKGNGKMSVTVTWKALSEKNGSNLDLSMLKRFDVYVGKSRTDLVKKGTAALGANASTTYSVTINDMDIGETHYVWVTSVMDDDSSAGRRNSCVSNIVEKVPKIRFSNASASSMKVVLDKGLRSVVGWNRGDTNSMLGGVAIGAVGKHGSKDFLKLVCKFNIGTTAQYTTAKSKAETYYNTFNSNCGLSDFAYQSSMPMSSELDNLYSDSTYRFSPNVSSTIQWWSITTGTADSNLVSYYSRYYSIQNNVGDTTYYFGTYTPRMGPYSDGTYLDPSWSYGSCTEKYMNNFNMTFYIVPVVWVH